MLPIYPLMEVYAGASDSCIPEYLLQASETDSMQRLGKVGMNCGCEYTSFERFKRGKDYSRLAHSLGVGMILWKHTGDPAQTLAGLFHDIATPVFAHVIDFYRGDYLTQESTEEGTEERIVRDQGIVKILRQAGLGTEQVCNYHVYPMADKDSPCLCADRLEYTLGNLFFYGFASLKEIGEIYRDIHAGETRDGNPELMFSDMETAVRFGMLSLQCAKVYVSDEDRYAMQMLSELIGRAVREGVITESDLYTTEDRIVSAIVQSSLASEWEWFCSLSSVQRAPQPGAGGLWRRVQAKKRCIDPYIEGLGRLSEVSVMFAQALAGFLSDTQDAWLMGYGKVEKCRGD